MAMNSVGRLFAPNLPSQIKKARARAVEHPQLFLKGKVTALVQVLITYTNLKNIKAPLRFNRERPATLLGVATRTIDRLLKELESLGWLTRLPQPRLGDGVWGCTSVAWSPWVIRDIFSVDAKTNKSATKPSSQPTSIGQTSGLQDDGFSDADRATNTAHLSSSPKGEVFQNKVASDGSDKSSRQPFDPFNERKSTGRRIPEDLVEPMNELGLTPANMCLLMFQCKKKGKRLQDVLKATRAQLSQKRLQAKEALSWLLYMIGLNRNYAYEADQNQKMEQRKRRTEKRTALLARLADTAFKPGSVLPNGLVVAQRADGIVTVSKPNGSAVSAAPEMTLIETLAIGNLSWVRRVLRGHSFVQVATSHDTGSAPVTSCDDEVSRLKDESRVHALSQLQAMKNMIKQTPSFARVRM